MEEGQRNENNRGSSQQKRSHILNMERRRGNQDGDQKKYSKKNSAVGKAKAVVKMAKNISAALKQMDFTKDWPYVLAFFAAVGKDILDLPGIGSLFGIGTVITICVSIFIFFMTLYAGAGGKGKLDKKIWRRFLVILIGTISEFLFGWNFVPAESAMVVVIYVMALFEKAGEAEEK